MSRHVYELVDDVDGLHHLRCPDCGKEVAIDACGTYRVLRTADGALLQGDFGVAHLWSRGVTLETGIVS